MNGPEAQNGTPTPKKLRVLFLEDDSRDAKLAARQLEQAGFELVADVVALEQEFVAALHANAYDIVLADYRLPGWSGLDALGLLRRQDKDTPFILFTGTVGEETAVECIKEGANDYVLKDRPARLPHAVRRALQDRLMRAERRNAERSRDLLASIVQSSDDAIVGMAMDGSIVSWNRGAEQIYGYPAAEIKGHPISRLFEPAAGDELRATLDILRRGDTIERYESTGIRKEGTPIDISVTMSAIRGERITGFSAIIRDITQQKRLQKDFLSAQKMEAVGLLAAGIAHDFNNLLTVVTGYSSLALEQLETNESARLQTELEEIHKAGERAASLTRQLLAFSRKQVMQPTVVNLNDIVSEMERLLHRVIGEDIALTITLEPALKPIKADSGQIEQVIMNLAVNARDAMPKGGRLSIETAHSNSGVAAPDVVLNITDTGTGMDARTQARIFEPFFTTKGVGEGTGLGLATVYGIVDQSGGRIAVESEPGRGTTFRICFPAVEESRDLAPPTVPMKQSAQGCETLLVVEDEDSVRKLVCGLLKRSGYHVLMARSGGEALKLCETYTDRIDLLISDLIMPAMSGTELYERMIVMRPEVKVLFISGYSDEAIENRGLLASNSVFLQKPFPPDVLTRKVREILDS
jgi:PAS domain S-box-containing protein